MAKKHAERTSQPYIRPINCPNWTRWMQRKPRIHRPERARFSSNHRFPLPPLIQSDLKKIGKRSKWRCYHTRQFFWNTLSEGVWDVTSFTGQKLKYQPWVVRGITVPCEFFIKYSTNLFFPFSLKSCFKDTEGNTIDVGDECKTSFKCFRSTLGEAAKSSILN